MASTDHSTNSPLSLLHLPTEMHIAILTHLHYPDLHTLRLTNRHFYALIPPPTHAELLTAETLDCGLPGCFLTCAGCTRLRPLAKFSSKMNTKKKRPGKAQAYKRFCIECGRRPLPGEHRYSMGSRWDENGVPYARCLGCERIARGPEDEAIPLCLSCHTQNLEMIERSSRRLEAENWEKRWNCDRGHDIPCSTNR